MNILEYAIQEAKGVVNLAKSLSDDQAIVSQATVSNWRARGLPNPWRKVLEARHPEYKRKFIRKDSGMTVGTRIADKA